jgi:hypothetical protein
LKSNDSGIRYWGAIGILTQGAAGVAAAHGELIAALRDDSAIVRVVAAEALGKFGYEADRVAALDVLTESIQPEQDAYLAVAAWNALDHLGTSARPAISKLREAPPEPREVPKRYGDYARRLKQFILKQSTPE